MIKVLFAFKNLQFKIADKIAIQHSSDKKLIPKNYRKKISIVYNWTDKVNAKTQTNLSGNILYMGNLGVAQNGEKFIKLIKNIKNENYKFHFFCDKKKLKLENSKNIFFYDFKDENLIFQNNYDIGLISLSENLINNNIPGKFISYLENNLPVILYCTYNSVLSEMIKKFNVGIVVRNEVELLNSINDINQNIYFYRKNCKKLINKYFLINEIPEFKI